MLHPLRQGEAATLTYFILRLAKDLDIAKIVRRKVLITLGLEFVPDLCYFFKHLVYIGHEDPKRLRRRSLSFTIRAHGTDAQVELDAVAGCALGGGYGCSVGLRSTDKGGVRIVGLAKEGKAKEVLVKRSCCFHTSIITIEGQS